MALNANLVPDDSPLAQSMGAVSPYVFDYYFDRNTVNNAKITRIDAGKLSAGTIVVALSLGSSTSGSLIFDGANNRILVHDGTTNRIVIGSV